MYTNFIYFILAIMIYATYQAPEASGLAGWHAALASLVLIAGFTLFTRWSFARVLRLAARAGRLAADHRFTVVATRQAIVAILLYAFMVHGLGLPTYGHGLAIFRIMPTLLALLFVLLFLALLVIVWLCAHPCYRRLYDPRVDRRTYVATNIRMSVPILIPWLTMSIVADVIFALPFEAPRRFLSSTEGLVVYFLFFLVVVAVAAPAVIQKMWGCFPLEPGLFRDRIQALCGRAGIRYRNILYWPLFGGRMLTAGVMGIVHRFRYILVTDALLKTLTPEEIDAVIAHEIGHVRRHHLLYFMLILAGFMLTFFAVQDLIRYLIITAKPLYRFMIGFGMTQVELLFSLSFLLSFLLYFRFLFGYFMRNFERQADIFVYTLFDSARPLISTFQKITAASGQAPDKPNWHHFSISERVRYLLQCEQDPRWIDRHNRKVRLSLAAFVAGLALAGWLGFQLNYGPVGYAVGSRIFEKIIPIEIEKDPENADLLILWGDYNYSRKDYAATAQAYERAIELQPHNAQVLNNLAWLYATCEDAQVRQPARALALARRAVALEPGAAHILDTLAESYFVNGNIEEAIRWTRQALAVADEPRDHYFQQLARFRQARDNP